MFERYFTTGAAQRKRPVAGEIAGGAADFGVKRKPFRLLRLENAAEVRQLAGDFNIAQPDLAAHETRRDRFQARRLKDLFRHVAPHDRKRQIWRVRAETDARITIGESVHRALRGETQTI